MHHFSLSIALLLLFHLGAFPVATSNDPITATSKLSISCGSVATSVALNGKQWIADIQPKGSSLLQIKGSSTDSTLRHSSTSAHQVPHKTARISTSQFSYAFRVSPGEKILRLHFNPAPYKGFERLNDLFNVEAGPFILLANFSASLTAAALGVNTFSKEFCISLEQNQMFSVTFSPVTRDTTYAFLNGIQIIPVPLRLSYLKGGDHRAQVVGRKAPVSIDNTTALELTHRVMKQYLVSFSDEFDDKEKENEINGLTRKTSVDVGFRYLVRIHFCDLGLQGEGLKVLLDEVIVDVNISVEWDDEYGIIEYRDYVMAVKGRKEEGKRELLISLQSNEEFVDANQLINGFEIFKLSNPDNSLASPNVFPPKSNSPLRIINILLPILSQGNATATLAIAILAMMNIIVYKLREVCEARSTTDEENIPSAKAERLCRRFSLAEIQSATKNFSGRLLIGRGGFGKVYIGFIDNGRETVAIMRLKSDSRQGKHEFLTEIETLCELRHINLVSQIGYCSYQREMILVYEYMPSGTLADHLHEYAREGKDSCSLTWKQRLDICIGTARGLEYLHTGNRIIYHDVKASNILLDENLIAKVSDFGLAKHEDRIKLQSHIGTRVKGTHGHMDPYYQNTGKLTRKSDIYAFGVVLLEVLCERKALGPRFGEEDLYLTIWAQNKIKEGEVDKIVASTLLEEILPDSLKAFVEVAERCLHKEPKQRPTMAQIVVQLESALELQESGKSAESNHVVLVANDVCPTNEHMTSSANTALSAEAFSDVYVDTSPPMEQRNLNYFPDGEEEPKSYKAHFWALDALWNRLKPSKRKEIRLASELCEADIKVPKYEFSKLAAATNLFSNSNKIGQGGSSRVYKAVLPTGRTVAAKRFFHP
ncbi:receptor-like protein kinase FERONIA [Salvia splendens]|uniref:receptor-like protein kinase FERONIA n=1 Tax=Salvia splendens TaxID=180675 RepID=UPI001C26A69D|nr:receptor-like protein kinase FERONIA [Salvia splendens]XP_042025930.1 receptor-like protein kinase FERONIA [Salvia splendens]